MLPPVGTALARLGMYPPMVAEDKDVRDTLRRRRLEGDEKLLGDILTLALTRRRGN